MHYRVVGAAIWSPVSPVSPRISKPWRPSVTTFTFGRRDKRGIIIRRTRPEYRECNNLVWLVLRFCHATHSTASPLLALAVLDVNTKTEMFLLMLKHPAAGLAPIPSLLVNWEPGRKIKFLSLIYLRQNCNPTQPNTIQCKSANYWILLFGRNWSSEFILLLSGARHDKPGPQSLWLHLINKSSWRQYWDWL